MRYRLLVSFVAALPLLGACTKGTEPADKPAADGPAAEVATVEASGLGIRKIRNGYGRSARPGDFVTVHYTGWLYDEAAPDNRGEQFDSSVDRDQKFQFTLGESRVIDGWHRGVEGMLIGETRELTIPPELGYGDRGAGGGVIPPGATLVFEIELFNAESPDGE